MEVVSHAYVAKRQNLLDPSEFEPIYNHSEQLAKMLSGLRASLIPR